MIEALKKMGYNPKIHEKAAQLHGYQGDARSQQAHIVIPRSQISNASNDIGFERESDGTYTIHVSAFDKKNWDKKFPEIIKHYTTDVVHKIVESGPYQWENQTVDANGVTTIRLTVKD